MKTRAILAVSSEILMTILMGLKAGEELRAYVVRANALPNDALLVRTFVDPRTGFVMFLLESEHFDIPEPARIHDSGYRYLPTPQLAVKHIVEAA